MVADENARHAALNLGPLISRLNKEGLTRDNGDERSSWSICSRGTSAR